MDEQSMRETIEQYKAADLPRYEQLMLDFTGWRDLGAQVADLTTDTVQVVLTDSPTEVPNGQKLVPITVPEDIDRVRFLDVLSGAYQTYLETSRLDPGDVAKMCGLPRGIVQYVMSTQEFAFALACRGINPGGAGTLTRQQDAALMILSDIGSRKDWTGRLKDAGISQATFTAWLKNPTFARRWNSISEGIAANHGLALVQLGQKVGQGDMSAIKLQLAVSGRYSESQQTTIDVMVTMNRILEILTKHLIDQPQTLRAIAQDMRRLGEDVTQQKIVEIADPRAQGMEF